MRATDMFCRPFSPSDLAQVRRLHAQIVREGVLHGEVQDPPNRWLSLPRRYFFVAESSGKVIGLIVARERKAKKICIMPSGTRYLVIAGIYVERRFRDKGVGTALLRLVMRVARMRGVRRFRVYTGAKDHAPVLRFYCRAGFKPWYSELFV